LGVVIKFVYYKTAKGQIHKTQLKAKSIKCSHIYRVAALPKAFTSMMLSGWLPLSIWTMTYLPDVS